jgi:hypothetical protein
MISKVQSPTFFSSAFFHFLAHLSQLHALNWRCWSLLMLCRIFLQQSPRPYRISCSKSIIRVSAVHGSEPTPSITLFTCWEFLDRVMGIFSRPDFLYFLTINSNTRSCIWGSCCLVLVSWFVYMWSVMIVLWLLLFWIIRAWPQVLSDVLYIRHSAHCQICSECRRSPTTSLYAGLAMLSCLDCCFYMDKLTLTNLLQLQWGYYWHFRITYVCWVWANIVMSGLGLVVAFGNATITEVTDVCIMICLNIWVDYYVLV